MPMEKTSYLEADEVRALFVYFTEAVPLQFPVYHGEGEGHGARTVHLVYLPRLAEGRLDNVTIVLVILK